MISFLLILSGNKTLTENVKSGATTLLALLPTEFALQLIHERTDNIERTLLRNILTQWGPYKHELELIAPMLCDNMKKVLTSLANGSAYKDSEEVVKYYQCRIHGDLHLGNIMIGANNVFIDYALSNVGPIAVDIAKLASDLLIKYESLRDNKVPDWDDDSSKLMSIMKPIKDVSIFIEGDKRIFKAMLNLYLVSALMYYSINAPTKKWVKKVCTEL